MRRGLAILATLLLAGVGVGSLTMYASGATGSSPSAFEYGTTTGTSPSDGQYGTTTTGSCGKPVNLVPPAITGAITVGGQLHSSGGTWACDPTSFHYAWSIPAGTGTSPTGSDSPDVTVLAKSDFFVTVTACNQSGCGEASACASDGDPGTPADEQYEDPIVRCKSTTADQ
jgi:hypothetical protein